MGYSLNAFVCRHPEADILVSHFSNAQKVDLGQDLSLIPMTEELYDEINNFETSESISKFEYLTENIELRILSLVDDKSIAYVEAEYFGGEGGQMAVIWKGGIRERTSEFGQGKINEVLQYFGVVPEDGKDEFDSLRLGWHRSTKQWLTNK